MRQKTVNVFGQDYVLQKIMPREWIKLRRRCKDSKGELDDEKFYSEILQHIVVNPKMTIDDFEEIEDLEEVVKEAITFQCKREEE